PDAAKILTYYSDDVVLHIPTGRLDGKAAVRDNVVRPLDEGFSGNVHVVQNLIHGINVVAVKWSLKLCTLVCQCSGIGQERSSSGMLRVRIRSHGKISHRGQNLLLSRHPDATDRCLRIRRCFERKGGREPVTVTRATVTIVQASDAVGFRPSR